jgi:transcriptional regulator
MATRDTSDRAAILQGTLDLLILKTLAPGAHHGHGIAVAIQRASLDSLLVDHGSLFPALQRLEKQGLIRGAWGTSDNNRRARFYTLSRKGRAQLVKQTSRWERLARAVALILDPRHAGG